MHLKLALRSLLKQWQSNVIKILCLGTGLAIGLMLFSKVFFEVSYDNFYPDIENIYLVKTSVQTENEEEKEYPQVSGAIAPGIKDEAPEVEAATRFTYFYNGVFFDKNRNRLTGRFILADSCFFDILPRPMLAGNAKSALSQPMYALVSSSIAKKMGGDVVGQSIQLDGYPGRDLTIGGIFEALPHNSSYNYDVIVSMASIGRFTWDGSKNWLGNDRYLGFVKLRPGVDPNSLSPSIRQMQEKYQDIDKMKEQSGVKLSYLLFPLAKLHGESADVKRMVRLLGLLAFALIFTAVMNYVLIVVSGLVRRTKEMAIYKSYGAEKRNISRLIYVEVFIHLVAALLFAALLVAVFKGMVEELLGVPISALLTPKSSLMLLIVVVVIFITTGIIPARLFSSIPVASAFRSFKQSRRSWMLALLFVQLAAATFLVTLLVVVNKQYALMVSNNPGYSCENVVYCDIGGTKIAERQTALDLLNKLPDASVVATADMLLFIWAAGNNVSLPGQDKELFNMADLYRIDENYLSLMDIKIVEGKGFEKEVSTENSMIVSQSFAKRISELVGWSDGIVGKELDVTEHGLCRVVGVYSNIRIGSIAAEDKRPSAMFYTHTPASKILVKLHKLSSSGIEKVTDALKKALPNKDIVVTPYKDELLKRYNESRLFRNSVLVGSVIALLLSLIGLLAYLRSEINRRSAEIAIRKVNGASISNVIMLFAKSILLLAIPALLVGGFLAYFAAAKWMENFSEKATLGLLAYALCALGVLAVTMLMLTASCWRAAAQNPIVTLKND